MFKLLMCVLLQEEEDVRAKALFGGTLRIGVLQMFSSTLSWICRRFCTHFICDVSYACVSIQKIAEEGYKKVYGTGNTGRGNHSHRLCKMHSILLCVPRQRINCRVYSLSTWVSWAGPRRRTLERWPPPHGLLWLPLGHSAKSLSVMIPAHIHYY